MAQRIRGAAAGKARRRERLTAAGLALLVIFVLQFAALCYFNFTQMRNHTGYDSSWNFLRAALIWNEKALVSPAWSETTNLHLDTHWPLASLLYGLTGNILLSFGIANTVMILLILLFMWKILDGLDAGLTGKLAAMNLVICPYLSTGFSQYNDLGYFSNVLSGASYYSLRILVTLMIIHVFLKTAREGRTGLLPWAVWPICLLCGFSSGVYLLIVTLIPCLLYTVEMAAIRNDWRQLIRKESLFLWVCSACVAAGKVLALVLIRFTAIDSSRSWTSLEGLWTNFGAVIQGSMKLLQVLPVTETNYAIISLTGLLRVFILLLYGLIVLSVAAAGRRALKNPTEQEGARLFLVHIVAVNFLVFGLYNARYGASIFEERYLLTTFFTAALTVGLFFGTLERGKVLSALLCVALAGSLAAVDAHSDFNYLRTTNDEWQMDEIQALAEERNAGVVYFWGDELTVVGRALRACDMNRVYKELPDGGGWFIHWGDYTTYDNQEEYGGPTLLVCPREPRLVPEDILAQFTLVKELDAVDVYASDRNPKLF